MQTKFMRNYLIKCIFEDDTTLLIGDENYQNKENWSYPDLLTVYFDINRNTFASSNEAHLQIYNLSQANRQRLFHDKFANSTFDILEVYAGYGQDLSLIFRGRILQAYSYKNNADIITDIQAIDLSFMQYQKDGKQINFTNQTFEADTTLKEIVNQIMGNNEATLGAVGTIGDKTFQTPVTLLGNTMAVIDELTGGHVFVDLGKLNVLANKECINVGNIPVIDSSVGLLETPMRRDVQLEIDILLEPTIIVGQAIDLQTSTGVTEYNGIWKVIGIHHTGVISSTTCGTMKTRLNLLTGVLTPETDLALVEQPEEEVTQVDKNKVENITNTNINSSCRDVDRYIKKYNKAPHTYIPDTRIYWDSVIKEVASYGKPPLEAIANLYAICRALADAVRKKYGDVKIAISSGYRQKAKNTAIGGASGSLHLTGKAIDITKIGNLKLADIAVFCDSLNWQNKGVIYEPYSGCVHLDMRQGLYLGLEVSKHVYKARSKYTLVRDR